jgi:LysM repeat protein
MCPLWFAQRFLEPMRRTLAALVLAMTPPLSLLGLPGVQAQQVVVVRAGETLSEIAERHNVSLSRLMQANGISNADLVVQGQRLTIPGSGSAARSASGSGSSQGTAPYTVKDGETLSEIADRFNTTTARLIQINNIRDPDLVMSGTRLQVPLSAQRSTAARSSPPAVNRNASEHVVQPGDNLSLIAERYGTSVSRLVALNQLEDPELVKVGTRLKLRGTPPSPRSTPQATAQPKPAASQPVPQPAPPPQSVTQPVAPAPSQQPQVSTQPAATPQPAGGGSAQAQPASVQPPTAQLAPPQTNASSATPAIPAATSVSAATTRLGQVSPSTALSTPSPAAVGQARSATSTATSAAAAPGSMAAAATPAAATALAGTAAAATASTATLATAKAPTTATAAAQPTATATAAARPAGDWRSYGPLQVDWSKIQPMGGSYVAPSLNSEGQPLYLAVNCTARKINVTSQAGQWRTWENPSKDFEHKLVKDICQANRS